MWAVALGVATAGVFAAAYPTAVPRCAWWGPVLWRGSVGTNRAALTFDDGPTPGATEAVVDELRRLGAPGAFFVVGRQVDRRPDLVRAIDAAGHLVGSHSYDHDHLGLFRGPGYWRRQVGETSRAIGAAIGRRPNLFRPPMGVRTPVINGAVRAAGMTTVTWSRRAFDGLPTTAGRIERRLVGRVVGGDIVALHDGVEPHGRREPAATVAALGAIVDDARRRGVVFVRLDELLGVPASQERSAEADSPA